MDIKETYLAVAFAAFALTGCGGSHNGSGSSEGDPVYQDYHPVSSYSISCTDTICVVKGIIDENITFTADKQWVLSGYVFVGNGNKVIADAADLAAVKADSVTLTVEPGTDVRGLDDSALFITRGSKIMAEGTAAAPITFSSIDDNFDGLGEWGGVIIQGFAPYYAEGGVDGSGNPVSCFASNADGICNVQGEGGDEVGKFGGNDESDNSGVMTYVRIAEPGYVAGPNNELNGLSLQGVGYGTTINHIQVHNSLDDAIEWFGGNVDVKYAVLTGNDDDDIDFDTGYRGNIQFAIVRKSPTATGPQGGNDPRGIEANSSDSAYQPHTLASLSNILIVGSEVNKAANSKGDAGQPGMRLRGSVNVNLYNTAVINFTDCVRIDDSNTDDSSDKTVESYSHVVLDNVIGQCDTAFYHNSRVADTAQGTVGAETVAVDTAAAYTGNVAGTLSTSIPVIGNSGFVFDNAQYIGAVAPGTTAANAWWAGWIIDGSLSGIESQGQTAQ